MDCTLLRETVLVNETVYEGSSEQPIDAELTLPDYCADIGKILKCRAVPKVTSRVLRGDGLTVEGITRIIVLYSDGRNASLCCYEHEIPFSATYKLREIPQGAKATAWIKPEYVNCRAVSQRKLDIHGAFTVAAKVMASTEAEIVSGTEGAGVKVRCDKCDISSLAGMAQSTFTVSDALEIAEDKASIGSIIRNDAMVKITECKAISNKLVMKGEATLELVYCGESGEGVQHMSYTLDFNEFIDVPGIDDGCMWDVNAECSGVDIGLRTDSNGEYRRMNVDIHIFVDVKAYKDVCANIVNDAYSVDYEVDVERRQLRFTRFCGTLSDTVTAPMLIETGETLFSAIDDVKCEVTDCKLTAGENRANVRGTVSVSIIGKDAEGACAYCEKLMEFTAESVMGFEVSCPRFDQRVAVTGCSYVITGNGKPEVRLNLGINAAVYDEVIVSAICAVTPDENRPKASGDAAVVMYCADAGEELWDIARAHNSCVETIMADNELESEVLEHNTRLLISI